MRKAALFFSLLLVAGASAAVAKPPVVVELYTAQGCASCGEADELAARLDERPDVLVLTFPVDYWDYLGWADTFAKPEFTARQKAYVTRLDLREPYTPQVVVDGRGEAPGLKPDAVERLVREAQGADRNPPDIAFIGPRRVDVGSGRPPKGGAEVWLVRYEPGVQQVTVRSGDNRGRTVEQRNVVREIKRLGPWRGRPTAYRVPKADDDDLKTVVLVQAAKGGRLIAVGEPKGS